jgi:acetate kinase
MKILVLNAGSSSVKFKLFKIDSGKMLAKGMIERIKTPQANLEYCNYRGESIQRIVPAESYGAAISEICKALGDADAGVIKSHAEIKSIGHRVVHGGAAINHSCRIDAEIKTTIRNCFELAPIHNPPNLACIEACESIFPNIAMVAVFDTAFHQTMPAKAYTYAIPADIAAEKKIRRYGFHGTSHHYVAQAAAEMLGRPFEDLKLITAHLGNGCSITAVDRGKVAETSMGLTPLEGLVMGTRCGDIDPTVIFLLQNSGYAPEEVDRILNKSSGLRGIAQIDSNDMRDLMNAAASGNAQARLALDVFIHRLVKYVGAYAAVLNGCDALVFTAGIGENVPMIRARTCEQLAFMGVALDSERNERNDKFISTAGSKPAVLVVPTDEELMIARETALVLDGE